MVPPAPLAAAVAMVVTMAYAVSSSAVDELATHAPRLGNLHRRVHAGEGAAVAHELRSDPNAEIMRVHSCNATTGCGKRARAGERAAFPIVAASGMGDSCFNAGMLSLASIAGEHLGVYSRCIPTGDNVITDTLNSFLMTMDGNVDEFATRVRADENLRAGFYAFGVSQGSNVIRGYIQRYNDPPVVGFMSLSSPIVGVAAFPYCAPDIPVVGVICQVLAEFLGSLAYLPLFQSFLFQANYFRDPTKLDTPEYREHSQLASWNNEGLFVNNTFRENMLRTQQLISVMALQDAVVWPVVGQQWGAPAPGQWEAIQTMRETDWWMNDLFGLRSMDGEGRLFFEEFAGGHIGFSTAQLLEWLDRYFR
jgi:palmitoyl-protein thioesterase|eukprot:COSAG02_NODE_2679_length_8261_cov_3.398922_7_plen_364_part_00